MKKMKRVLVALLSCLTAFACLAGTVACGKDKKEESASTPNTSVSVESPADSSSEVTEESSEVVEESSEVVEESSEVVEESSEVEVPSISECNHIFDVAVPEIPATCVENGRGETVACSICAYIVDPAPILLDDADQYATYAEYEAAKEKFVAYWAKYSALGGAHDFTGAYTTLVAANCCQPGTYSYTTCKRCETYKLADGTVTTDAADLVIEANGPHKYLTFTTAIPATCETSGCTEGWTCENGGAVDSKFVDALGHSYVFDAEEAGYILGTVAPTCEENAICWCGEELEDTALGHSYVSVDAKAVTCTEDGWAAYEYCDREGCKHTTFDAEIAKTLTKSVHWAEQRKAENYTKVPAVKATHSTPGNTEHYVCNDCFAIRKTLGGAVVESVETTCGGTVLPLTDSDKAVAATCLEAGQKAGGECQLCKEYVSPEVIEAKGHSFDVKKGGRVASCTADAKCSNSFCDLKGGILEGTATGHAWEFVDVKYNTCKVDAIRAHYECANEGCGLWALENAEESEEKGKNDGWVDGYKQMVSTNQAFVIKAGQHGTNVNWVVVEAKAPTCAEAGNVAYKICGMCYDFIEGNKTFESVVIPATGEHKSPLDGIDTCSKYITCETIYALTDTNKDGVIDINDVEDKNGDEIIDEKDYYHVGCGYIYANDNFKSCVDADDDDVCDVCGKEACKHNSSVNGYCPDCRFCAHNSHDTNGVCKACKVNVGHKYALVGANFVCACGVVCAHNEHNEDLNCKVCGNAIAGAAHDFSTGVCACGKACPHDSYDTVNNKCNVCQKPCDHASHDIITGKCYACNAVVAHTWSAANELDPRTCGRCGKVCYHETHNGDAAAACKTCGVKVGHTYDLENKVTIGNDVFVYCDCGYENNFKNVCAHEGKHSQAMVCQLCGGNANNGVAHRFTSLTDGSLKCDGCNKQFLPSNITESATINVDIANEVENVAAIVVKNGATLTIVGGRYSSVEGTVVKVESGKVVIEGGEFFLTGEDADASKLLDGNYEVKGGTFKGFKPVVAAEYEAVGQVEIYDAAGAVVGYEYYTVQKKANN